jgi:hypothetical protein
METSPFYFFTHTHVCTTTTTKATTSNHLSLYEEIDRPTNRIDHDALGDFVYPKYCRNRRPDCCRALEQVGHPRERFDEAKRNKMKEAWDDAAERTGPPASTLTGDGGC